MLEDKLKLLPSNPGCYFMKDIDDNIIYIGKAKNIKRRVLSYFNKTNTGKTKVLVDNICDLDYIITSNEVESLLLEINSIKKYKPKYNILLKDDKSYPYIELTNEKYPRLIIKRYKNRKKNSGDIFGPYPNSYAARQTVDLLNSMFPLIKCVNLGKKECLYYHIDQCLGYCIKDISKATIDNMKNEIKSFLKGNYEDISNELKKKMKQASNDLNYEKAQEYKKQLEYIEQVLIKQKIDSANNKNIDVFGHFVKDDYICIQVFYIRDGKIIKRDKEVFALLESVNKTLEYYIVSFYQDRELPEEILTTNNVNTNIIFDILKTKISIPKIGDKKHLIDLVVENAKLALEEDFELIKQNEKRTFYANEQLGKLLNINNLKTIEIFDNSQLFGTFTVSGMVVFKNGEPDKSKYRKYKIKDNITGDYNIMKEVIYRRYFKVLYEGLSLPNLILVDGGEIQVKAALEVLNSLNIDVPVYGLKKDSSHNTNMLVSINDEIHIDKKSNVFHYITRIQDEVHRYTINYHKNIRSKGLLSSYLDDIKGLGKVRKERLLRKYKTINELKKLTVNQLSKDLPIKVAVDLYNSLLNND